MTGRVGETAVVFKDEMPRWYELTSAGLINSLNSAPLHLLSLYPIPPHDHKLYRRGPLGTGLAFVTERRRWIGRFGYTVNKVVQD